MGSRSSKFTKLTTRQPDPRKLTDAVVSDLASLVRLCGTGSGKGHPSSRQERRAAMRALRHHVKTAVGRNIDFGRIFIPPKYPNRMTDDLKTVGELCKRDVRKKN